jgi:hypothetical protein
MAAAMRVDGVKMAKYCGTKKYSALMPIVILVYFVINFRVEAGIATPFERGLDGLVGGTVLLLLLYIGARFFKFLNPAGKKDPLACCDDNSKK